MTKPPDKLEETICKSKRRFPDEITARAGTMNHLQCGSCTVPVLFVYHCPICNGWHMTKRPRRALAVTAQDAYASLHAARVARFLHASRIFLELDPDIEVLQTQRATGHDHERLLPHPAAPDQPRDGAY